MVKNAIGRKINDYLSMNDSYMLDTSATLKERMKKAELAAKQRQCSVSTITYNELEKSGMNLKETIRAPKINDASFMTSKDEFNDLTIDQGDGISRIYHKNDTTNDDTMYQEFHDINNNHDDQ